MCRKSGAHWRSFLSSAERFLSRLGSNDVWEGFKTLLPISFFVIVFGVAFGLAAVQTGLGESSILAMSTLVFAGAAQFAVLKLWGEHVPLIPLIITVFAINARHLLMGATLYPWLRELPRAKRYGVMLVVSDANWAMSMQAFNRGEPGLGLLFGGGVALWSAWSLGSWMGIYFGSASSQPPCFGSYNFSGWVSECLLLAGS